MKHKKSFRIQEQREEDFRFDITKFLLTNVAFLLVSLLVMFSVYFFTSKRNRHLEKIIRGLVTGKVPFGSRLIIKIVDDESPNAFVFAYGIPVAFITKGLLNLCEEREQVAILLHECSHLRNFDSLKGTLAEFGLVIALFKGMEFLNKKYGDKKVRKSASEILQLILFGTAFGLMFLLARNPQLLLNITLGKRAEMRSDDYPVKFGYGRDLVLAFRKMIEWQSLHTHTPACKNRFCSIFVKLENFFDEHPAMKNRIERVLQKTEVWEATKSGKTSEIVSAVKKSIQEHIEIRNVKCRDKLLEERVSEIVDKKLQQLCMLENTTSVGFLLTEQIELSLFSQKVQNCLTSSHEQADKDLPLCRSTFFQSFTTKGIAKVELCKIEVYLGLYNRALSCLEIALSDCKGEENRQSCEKRINNHIDTIRKSISDLEKGARSLKRILKNK